MTEQKLNKANILKRDIDKLEKILSRLKGQLSITAINIHTNGATDPIRITNGDDLGTMARFRDYLEREVEAKLAKLKKEFKDL